MLARTVACFRLSLPFASVSKSCSLISYSFVSTPHTPALLMQSYATTEANLAAPAPLPVSGGDKKRWILNAFEMSTSGHQFPGLWKHPKDRSSRYHDIEYWTELSKTLERGKFNGILCVPRFSLLRAPFFAPRALTMQLISCFSP